MTNIPLGFHPDQSANEVHLALKSSLVAMEKAQRSAVLWFGEFLDRKLYRELGYSSINQYAKLELGFSTSRTGDFLQLCRKLKTLPNVKAKVESGELGYTAARVIAPIVDETNEAGWLEFALNSSRRELEQEVKLAKREAAEVASGQVPLLPVPHARPVAVVPVRVGLEMSPTQFARYENLWEQVRKRTQAPADKVEALLEMMASFVDESSPRGEVSSPPAQLHVHKCSECENSSVSTSRGELELGQAELERVQCDCRISRPRKRNTTSIPPATRRQVLAHYRHKCQQPGCGRTNYLEIHHVVPRSRGGTNDPGNLTCLCSACHRLVHDKKGFAVSSPLAVYQWDVTVKKLTKLSRQHGVVLRCEQLGGS